MTLYAREVCPYSHDYLLLLSPRRHSTCHLVEIFHTYLGMLELNTAAVSAVARFPDGNIGTPNIEF